LQSARGKEVLEKWCRGAYTSFVFGRRAIAVLVKSVSQPNKDDCRTVQLLRGGRIVSSLVGAFGHNLRETRLTALLGYLAALAPEAFAHAFDFDESILSVSLETSYSGDRSDIHVETAAGVAVIEAKVDGTNPYRQAMRYPAKWRVLLTRYVPSRSEVSAKNTRYLSWEEVAQFLRQLAMSSDRRIRFVASDLISYLEEYHMVKRSESVEVYARELNVRSTLSLFIEAHMYWCQYEKTSRLPEALYFAPHFGQNAARVHPGIRVGISHVARIETVEVVSDLNDLHRIVEKSRGRAWLRKHLSVLEGDQDKWQEGEKRSVLFLGAPRLVFNPPIRKETLQKGCGLLSTRFLSFDELFAAWGEVK
jgi:hypothetical protein